MKNVNIAKESKKVGEALTSVPLDQMIVSMAKGIAWGQYELDKVGMDVTKMMGVPGSVSIGDEQLSMLEAGFLPTFYHFVDTILELKMEINVRQEQSQENKSSATNSYSKMAQRTSSSSRSAKLGFFRNSAKASYKSSSKNESKTSYAKTVDAAHSQKYSQDLSATSLMRTKLVPKPAPDVLVERIQVLLERMRAEAKAAAPNGTEDEIFENLMVKIQQQVADEMAAAEF